MECRVAAKLFPSISVHRPDTFRNKIPSTISPRREDASRMHQPTWTEVLGVSTHRTTDLLPLVRRPVIFASSPNTLRWASHGVAGSRKLLKPVIGGLSLSSNRLAERWLSPSRHASRMRSRKSSSALFATIKARQRRRSYCRWPRRTARLAAATLGVTSILYVKPTTEGRCQCRPQVARNL